MPSLSETTEVQWKQMLASTDVATYRLMERIDGSDDPVYYDDACAEFTQKKVDLVIEADWIIKLGDGTLIISAAGRKHLRSF